jgi:hypothetical protein
VVPGKREELAVRYPFPGATTTPAAAFLFVATFAAVQLAAAVVSTRVVAFVRKREELTGRVTTAHPDTLPALAAETDADGERAGHRRYGQIVQASKHFIQRMLLHNEPVVGWELFEVVRFADAGAVRRLLAQGGALEECRYAVGGRSGLRTCSRRRSSMRT